MARAPRLRSSVPSSITEMGSTCPSWVSSAVLHRIKLGIPRARRKEVLIHATGFAVGLHLQPRRAPGGADLVAHTIVVRGLIERHQLAVHPTLSGTVLQIRFTIRGLRHAIARANGVSSCRRKARSRLIPRRFSPSSAMERRSPNIRRIKLSSRRADVADAVFYIQKGPHSQGGHDRYSS